MEHYLRSKLILRMFAAITVTAALFFLPGCSPKKMWLNDFDEAQALAAKRNKNIFLYFSAQDWDGESEKLKPAVFDTDDFLNGTAKKYILCNLDFSRSLYDQASPPEDATEEQIAAAEKVSKTIEKRGDVAQKYSVMELPSFFLLTKTGIVISKIDSIEGIEDAAGFLGLISQFDEKSEKINALVKTIAKTSGGKKVTAIDGLFEEIEPRFRPLLTEYFPLVLKNDPENKTGLLGKYQLQNAYSEAMNFYSQGDSARASEAFAAVSESEYLSAEEKQEAFYFAAFFLAQSPSAQIPDVLSLLQRAYDTAPESDAAPGIQDTMKNFMAESQNAPQEDESD